MEAGFTASVVIRGANVVFQEQWAERGQSLRWWHLISLEFLVRVDLGGDISQSTSDCVHVCLRVCVCGETRERCEQVSVCAGGGRRECARPAVKRFFRFPQQTWPLAAASASGVWEQPAATAVGLPAAEILWPIDMCVTLLNRGLWIFKQHRLLHAAFV